MSLCDWHVPWRQMGDLPGFPGLEVRAGQDHARDYDGCKPRPAARCHAVTPKERMSRSAGTVLRRNQPTCSHPVPAQWADKSVQKAYASPRYTSTTAFTV